MRITDQLVKTAPVPARGQSITWDDEIKGFGLRVTAGGVKTFVFNYRANGRMRRYKIGRYPTWSVAAARKRAGELDKAVDRGEDPQAKRADELAAPTVNDLCDDYIEKHLPRKRASSQRDDRAMIRKTIRPALGTLKVRAVTFDDIDTLHRKLKATPYQANRTMALLSKMFNLAIRWGWRADNPCQGIERFHEDRRERYLTADERARLLVALQQAADGAQNADSKAKVKQTVNAFRLAMLTGCRIGEALAATWDEFDLKAGTWTKPAATTKQRGDHRVYLNAPARALLAEMAAAARSDSAPDETDDAPRGENWVFPSRTGDGHQTDYRKTWQAIRDAAEIPDLRVHDLRHNFASEGASAGLSLPMIGALLGHTSPATTARYAHLMADPLKAAAELIGSRLGGVVKREGMA